MIAFSDSRDVNSISKAPVYVETLTGNVIVEGCVVLPNKSKLNLIIITGSLYITYLLPTRLVSDRKIICKAAPLSIAGS